MTESRESSRVKALERTIILDEATRYRRQRKALDALEKDNFQDEYASSLSKNFHLTDSRLQMIKKFQQRFALNDDNSSHIATSSLSVNESKDQTNSSLLSTSSALNQSSSSLNNEESFLSSATTAAATKKRKLKADSKLRMRKNFATMLEEEHSMAMGKKHSYFSINASASKFPRRKFCSVCGFSSNYNCIQCGTKYCSAKCLQIHKDTRCLKWTA